MEASRGGSPAHAGTGTASDRGYLDFIDGLRAISILAVVAFHIGLPTPRGGFFGVDIFFVISGFLIIGQIVADCETGTFRFGRFWARRVLRILPSYLLVILACVALSFFVLVTPYEASRFGEQVMMSAGFAMNSWLSRNFGYFGSIGDATELLHLWSLAVEEQFYIVAPIVIGLFFLVTGWFTKLLPRWLLLPAVIAAVFMWTLGIAMRELPLPSFSIFYHTEHRIWEFLAGGSAALVVPRLRSIASSVLQLASVVGIGCVAYAVFLYREADGFPSWQTLIPVGGAALVLASGSASPTIATRFLSWRPLRGIGLVSYAWYLWHWPLMSFAHIVHFGDSSVPLRTACAFVSFLLAVLTYLLLERPLAQHRRVLALQMPWRIVFAGLAACALTASLGWWISTERARELSLGLEPSSMPAAETPSPTCSLPGIVSLHDCLNDRGARPVALLLGDSHGTAASRAFEQIAAENGVKLITAAFGGCAPFLGTFVVAANGAPDATCSDLLDRALEPLRDAGVGVDRAVVEAQWILHTSGNRAAGVDGSSDDHSGFLASMRVTLQRLEQLGIKKILFLAPIPYFRLSAPECLIRADRTGASRDLCSITRGAFEAQRRTALNWLREALAGTPNVRLADPAEAFCDQDWCRPYGGGIMLYGDGSHLNHAGEQALYAVTKSSFDWLFGPD